MTIGTVSTALLGICGVLFLCGHSTEKEKNNLAVNVDEKQPEDDGQQKEGMPIWAIVLFSVFGVIALLVLVLIVRGLIENSYCAGGRPDRRVCRALGFGKPS